MGSEHLSYEYDAAGRRILAEVLGGVTQSFTYDRRGQVLSETTQFGVSIHETAYSYDLDGVLESISYPSGRVVSYSPDFAGRPTSITSAAPGGGAITTVLADASYLPFGQPTALQLGLPTGPVDESFEYDWQYRRTGQTIVGPSATTLLDLEYAYDPAGNLEDLTDYLGDRSANYGYDDLGRLTSAAFTDGARAYQYDAIGNMTRLLVDSGLPSEGELLYSYEDYGTGENSPSLSSISSTGGSSGPWSATVTDDGVGNLTSDSTSSYAYDIRNHLGSRQTGTANTEYEFTADGRRATAERTDTGAITHQILDTAGRRLALLEDGAWRDYIYLGDRLLAFVDSGGSEAGLVFTDHIGMPMLVVDGAGAVVWQAKAEPYGQLRGTISTTHDPGLRYPGQWQDDIELAADCTGNDCVMPGPLDQSFSLFENGYRWYRPEWGRYTQSDPIPPHLAINPTVRGNPAHEYLYAGGNPLAAIDQLGLRVTPDQEWKDQYEHFKECSPWFKSLVSYFEDPWLPNWRIRQMPKGGSQHSEEHWNDCVFAPGFLAGTVFCPERFKDDCKELFAGLAHEFYERLLIMEYGYPPERTGPAHQAAVARERILPYEDCCGCDE